MAEIPAVVLKMSNKRSAIEFLRRKTALSVGGVFLLSACSIHPLPEDSTGINTFDIISKIRCEARHAVKESLVSLIRTSKIKNAEAIADDIDKNMYKFKNMPYGSFDKETRRFMEKYDGTVIGYDFTFTMTEVNNVSTDISFLSILSRGTDGVNFKAGNSRERRNIRNVRVIDTFKGFFIKGTTCDIYSRIGNVVYPITGQVGIAEIIRTFFALNETVELEKKSKDDLTLFADSLRFTTTFSGSVNPKITISPVGKALSLGEASATADASRSDIHELVVSLSLPPDRLEASPERRAITKDRVNEILNYQIAKNRVIPLGLGFSDPSFGP